MSTPRKIHLFRNCGLKIEIDKADFDGLDYTNLSVPWRYNVTNCDQIGLPHNVTDRAFGGWLSPTSRLTLPPKIRQDAGIPYSATTFAFMYPPEGLANQLLQEKRRLSNSTLNLIAPTPNLPEDKQGISAAAILGGFAYFDKDCKCIRINALSIQSSESTLKLTGPFVVKKSACDELFKLRRFHPLQIDIFHEVGFVSYAWVRPEELFQFEGLFVCEKAKNSSGAMVFFREDGTGVAYAVDKSEYIDPTGHVGILSEPLLRLVEAKYTHHVIEPLYEAEAWGARVKHWTKSMDNFILYATLKNRKRVVHMACHASLGHDFISDVLSNAEEKSCLSYQDDIRWNPLHYACRFSPRDDALIKLLVTSCPEAVVQRDLYHRYPLHIACNSNASIEVITLLLEADTKNPKVTITQKTRRFGFLPLHLACFNGAQESIINALLEADSDRKTAVQKSKGGYLPLHLAILKKQPASIVKALLYVDTKLRKRSKSLKESFAPTIESFDADIYQSLDGMLPLHMACYNNASSEIVQLLLEKDEQKVTSNKDVDEALSQSKDGNGLSYLSDSFHMNGNARIVPQKQISNRNKVICSDYQEQGNGVVALHLAMRHGSKAVISLLLRKEMGIAQVGCQLSMLHKRDIRGRTPLHIACMYNLGSQIIQSLLELDPFNETTQMGDKQGFMPIHHACENKETSVETISMLLAAEEQCIDHEIAEGAIDQRSAYIRSTRTGDIERKRTPLYLAVRSGVNAKVIEILLKPENFTLKGFDDPAMRDLAELVVKNHFVQDEVIETLSERLYFCQLVLELYACIFAVTFFFYGSWKYVTGSVTVAEPSILLASAGLFTIRELLQILSVGVDYLGDTWSLFEVVNIGLLVSSASKMLGEANNPSEDLPKAEDIPIVLLIITGFFVLVQIILYLRNTIQPFARFVGGVLMIAEKLIPFLVVSLFVIWFFVYAFWIYRRDWVETTISHIFIRSFKLIFDFSFVDTYRIGLLEVLFAFLIIIVLLNILIAIVGEAWDSAAEKSNGLFWKYRVEKIKELRFATKYEHKWTHNKFSTLMEKIDNMNKIPYGSDVSWTKSPYHVVETKDQYENPHKYFDRELSEKIQDARSLHSTIYFEKINDNDFTSFRQFMLLLRWFGSLMRFCILVILGFPTLGVLWPKKFRSSLLTWDDSEQPMDQHNETYRTSPTTGVPTLSHNDSLSHLISQVELLNRNTDRNSLTIRNN